MCALVLSNGKVTASCDGTFSTTDTMVDQLLADKLGTEGTSRCPNCVSPLPLSFASRQSSSCVRALRRGRLDREGKVMLGGERTTFNISRLQTVLWQSSNTVHTLLILGCQTKPERCNRPDASDCLRSHLRP